MLNPLVASAAFMVFTGYFRAVSHVDYLSPRQLSGGSYFVDFFCAEHTPNSQQRAAVLVQLLSILPAVSVLLWAVYEGGVFLHQFSAT